MSLATVPAANQTTKAWIPCKVLGVFIHPTRNTPIVFIGDEHESTVVPIWIGFLEAQAILFAWKNVSAPRPLTIDLLAALVRDDLHAGIQRILVHTIKGGTYYASIEIKDKEGTVTVRDARPSDAIALALRSEAPMHLGAQVVQETSHETVNAKALLDFLRLESEDDAAQTDFAAEGLQG